MINIQKFLIIDTIQMYDLMNAMNIEINSGFDFINLILVNFFAYLLIAILIIVLKNIYYMIIPRKLRKWRMF